MPTILNFILTNLWACFLVVLFFGGSIFVHELGHFLAARRRGLKIERFSIGMGPKLWGWTGRDGVEYWLSWIPIGGYVKLPQLADLRGLEGPERDDAPAWPTISYTSKLIVLVAGAFFNVLFALFIATLLWFVGQYAAEETLVARIGSVRTEILLPDGARAPGPAHLAGLRAGDIVRRVDGRPVSDYTKIEFQIVIGSGRAADGAPQAVLYIERDGQPLTVTVNPVRIGDELHRNIGIEPAVRGIAVAPVKDSPAARAGLLTDDVITHINGQRALSLSLLPDLIKANPGAPLALTVERETKRDGKTLTEIHDLTVTPALVPESKPDAPIYRIGVSMGAEYTKILIYNPPWKQLTDAIQTTYYTLISFISPKSDIGIKQANGPIAIADTYHRLAKIDFRSVLWFTVMINVNLALLNLLPIPVLDGGHIAFATIGKLFGRPLPARFIMTLQNAFGILLIGTVIYVSYFDSMRVIRERFGDRSKPVPAAPTPTAAPAK